MTAPSLMACVATFQDHVDGYYKALRSLPGPLYRDASLDAWVVTGYTECAALLGSPALSRQRLRLAPALAETELGRFAQRVFQAQSNFADSDEARVRRRFWMRALHGGLGGTADVSCGELARAVLGARRANELDLFREILQPYASAVICSRLGLRDEERRGLYPHLERYARFLDGKAATLAAQEQALASIAALYHQLARKWDVLDHATMDRHEWTADYIFALAAGHDSVAYALATLVLHGGCDANLDAGAVVCEAFRFDSPVQLVGRRAVDTIELAGHRIQTGERLLLHLGAANRDHEMFPDADRFEPGRRGADLAFGWADSRCPGRRLAHDEAVVWVETVRDLRLQLNVDPGKVRGDHGLSGRGLACLPAMVESPSAGATHV